MIEGVLASLLCCLFHSSRRVAFALIRIDFTWLFLFAEVRAEIVGGPEKIYKAGSTVELKCDLIDSTEEPEYFWWYQVRCLVIVSVITFHPFQSFAPTKLNPTTLTFFVTMPHNCGPFLQTLFAICAALGGFLCFFVS